MEFLFLVPSRYALQERAAIASREADWVRAANCRSATRRQVTMQSPEAAALPNLGWNRNRHSTASRGLGRQAARRVQRRSTFCAPALALRAYGFPSPVRLPNCHWCRLRVRRLCLREEQTL